MTTEEKLTQWVVRSLVALAKRNLADANRDREAPRDWPAGQEWNQLVGSSQSIFMRKAREEAGISDAEYLDHVRGCGFDLEELWSQLETGRKARS